MDPSLIFVAVMALFVCYQLYATLGKRDGHEPEERDRSQPPRSVEPMSSDAQQSQDSAPLEQPAPKQQPDWAMPLLGPLPQFDADEFTYGAKAAYEMIVTGFAAGDKKSLKNLLSKEVYTGFAAAIDDRKKRGMKMTTQFIGIDHAEIFNAELEGKKALITMRFVSELVSMVRDKAGSVVEGDATETQNITDIWTFERNLSSRDPNWRLVATDGDEA